MLSPYSIQSNSHKRRQKISKTNLDDDSLCERDLKGLHMTSTDLRRPKKIELVKLVSNNKKNKLKGGSVQETDENNDEYLDEILQNNNI